MTDICLVFQYILQTSMEEVSMNWLQSQSYPEEVVKAFHRKQSYPFHSQP